MLLSPARMMLLLLPLLALQASWPPGPPGVLALQALAKPGQGRPPVKQWEAVSRAVLPGTGGLYLAISRLMIRNVLTHTFLTKEDQAMLFSAILPPYLGALFRSTKPETRRKVIVQDPRVEYWN